MQKTNKERLATIEEAIKHIDINIEKIANNNINQWKQINKNAQGISGIKGASGVIAFIISLATTIGITYFGSKQ